MRLLPATLSALALAGLTACGAGSSQPKAHPAHSTTPSARSVPLGPHAEATLPAGWKHAHEGATHIIGGRVPETFSRWLPPSGTHATVEYYSLAASRTPVKKDKVRSAIGAGKTALAATSPTDLQAMRESPGYGCASAFEIAGTPTTVEVHGGYALRYEYVCTTLMGKRQHSIAVTAYDWKGARKHNLTVSALAADWKAHRDDLRKVADTFSVD